MSASPRTDTEGVTVEVKIGIQNVAREIVIEATGSEADIEAAVRSALDGGAQWEIDTARHLASRALNHLKDRP